MFSVVNFEGPDVVVCADASYPSDGCPVLGLRWYSKLPDRPKPLRTMSYRVPWAYDDVELSTGR